MSWEAGPSARLPPFTLWKPDAVKVTKGEDQIGEYRHSEQSWRQWCTACGGHLFTQHPSWGLVDVYAATIRSFPFTPGMHVNYESTVLPMKDASRSSRTSLWSWAGQARRSPGSTATPLARSLENAVPRPVRSAASGPGIPLDGGTA